MNENVKKAIDCFSKDFNCAQAVFSAFAPSFGVDEKTALKIASGFGAGMAEQQHVCGAVTGAYMAIGCRFGKCEEGDSSAKELTYSLILDFTEQFTNRHETIICRDLLGCDISTEEGKADAKKKNLFNTLCGQFVADAADILTKILN